MQSDGFFNETRLGQSLKKIRQGKPFVNDKALLSLLLYQNPQNPVLTINNEAMIEVQVLLQITNVVYQKYNRLRGVHQLSPVAINEDATQSSSHLTEDFMVANQELEAWSILYYRYVRIDLGFSPTKLSGLARQTVRNLNRREKLGFTRLLQLLLIHSLEPR